jgi:hypothetical protein
MPQFYDHFLNQKMSKADALVNAKYRLLNDRDPKNRIFYQHPFYWAAFVLYGDPGTSHPYALNMKFAVISLSLLMSVALIIQYKIHSKNRL